MKAFKAFFLDTKYPCILLISDNERGIVGEPVKSFLKSIGVTNVTSNSKLHSYSAERMIQTLARRLFKYFYAYKTDKWLDAIKKIVKAYNNTKHSSLVNGKYTPNEVTSANAYEIERFQKGPIKRYPPLNKSVMKQRFKVGDLVVVSTNRRVFEKGKHRGFFKDSFDFDMVVFQGTSSVSLMRCFKYQELINEKPQLDIILKPWKGMKKFKDCSIQQNYNVLLGNS